MTCQGKVFMTIIDKLSELVSYKHSQNRYIEVLPIVKTKNRVVYGA